MSDEQLAGTVFDADEVVEQDVNGNGQVYLGRDLAGKTVRIAYATVDEYTCDDCDDEYPLSEVFITKGGDRVVCAGCAGVDDRIIS